MTALTTLADRVEGDSTAAELERLAERVEAASGPDRELDAEIALAIGYAKCRLPTADSNHRLPVENQFGHGFFPPAYTASLDAALSLIPATANSAGEIWRAEGYSDPGVLAPHVRASAWVAGAPRVYTATPALALTAACLKARASLARDLAGEG